MTTNTKETAMNQNELMTGVKVKSRRRTRTATASASQAGTKKIAITVVSAVPVALGLWAVACLVSAMVQGSPLGLVSSWLGAVTGV